jgi:hypothetical protein
MSVVDYLYVCVRLHEPQGKGIVRSLWKLLLSESQSNHKRTGKKEPYRKSRHGRSVDLARKWEWRFQRRRDRLPHVPVSVYLFVCLRQYRHVPYEGEGHVRRQHDLSIHPDVIRSFGDNRVTHRW